MTGSSQSLCCFFAYILNIIISWLFCFRILQRQCWICFFVRTAIRCFWWLRCSHSLCRLIVRIICLIKCINIIKYWFIISVKSLCLFNIRALFGIDRMRLSLKKYVGVHKEISIFINNDPFLFELFKDKRHI